MRIVVATDSFKGSLRSDEACRIIAAAIREVRAESEIVIKPMADGGEGTAAALLACGGRWIRRRVTGPLAEMEVEAGFVWFERDKIALVEMASASGLELLSAEQMNPLRTTTYGTGQLIGSAAEYGAGEILLAVGGSATVDGGVGAATALGWRFLDGRGEQVEPGGGRLERIAEIVEPEGLRLPAVKVLCDVDNPLCGPEGAARVYAPQKGANRRMVGQLEAGLAHLAAVVERRLGCDIGEMAGGGAAGGLAAGAVAFMNGTIVSGIETVIARANLAGELESADWVITGEGSFDGQSLRGKVVSGVAGAARKSGVRVAVIAGVVGVSEAECHELGIVTAIACKGEDMSLDYAMDNCGVLLGQAARRFAEGWLPA